MMQTKGATFQQSFCRRPHGLFQTYIWPCLFHVSLFKVVSCYLWYQLKKTQHWNSFSFFTQSTKNTPKHKSLHKTSKVKGSRWVKVLGEFLKKSLTSLSLPVGYAVFRYEQRAARITLYHVTISCKQKDNFIPRTCGKCVSLFLLGTSSHFWIFVINKKVSGVVFSLVGDLKPVRVSDLFRLECGVQVFDKDYSFGAFGLLHNK